MKKQEDHNRDLEEALLKVKSLDDDCAKLKVQKKQLKSKLAQVKADKEKELRQVQTIIISKLANQKALQ